ncbi:hypothetical protein MESS2_1050047 [Mesorhizobium metallidurans STM 2683]|uniref:Uncharacterized protein n=1 Tax=Mesorhizobium metallidurans STM 2683 TaxID=1297569 RepID=M5EH37_9HYPH|nr:hypothetical protein MESS2_1050047 [Mesorhizobium metallidurans STM 2683]
MVLQPLIAVDSASAATIANDFKRIKRSDAPPKIVRLVTAALSPSFMLAFALLAKRAMPICEGLRAGNHVTMAFRQQASGDCEAKSMGAVRQGCRKSRKSP